MAMIPAETIEMQVAEHRDRLADVKGEAARTWDRMMRLKSALEAAMPFLDNSDSPGGCDGTHDECEHCAAISAARAALKE